MIAITEPSGNVETQGTACPAERIRWTLIEGGRVRQYAAVYGPDGRLWVGNPIPEEGRLLRIMSGPRKGLVIKSGYQTKNEEVVPVGGEAPLEDIPRLHQLVLGLDPVGPQGEYGFPPVTVKKEDAKKITSTDGVRHEPDGEYIPLRDCTPKRGAKAFVHWSEIPSVQRIMPGQSGITSEWRYNL